MACPKCGSMEIIKQRINAGHITPEQIKKFECQQCGHQFG